MKAFDDEETRQNAPQNNEKQDEAESDEQETGSQAQTEQIERTGGITTGKGKHTIHCLTIIGQIEGHYILPATNKTTKYEHVIPQLLAVEQDPDIEGWSSSSTRWAATWRPGLAIAELLSGMKKPTVSLVLGGQATRSRAARGERAARASSCRPPR